MSSTDRPFQGMKDAPLPRPNKRPRLGPSPDEAESSTSPKGKSSQSKDARADGKNSKAKGKEAQLDEFMQVMQPRTRKGPSWKDDDAVLPATVAGSVKIEKKSSSKQRDAESSHIDERNGDSIDDEADENQQNAAVSDMDWLKRHMKSNLDISDHTTEKVFEQSDDEMDAEPTQPDGKVLNTPRELSLCSLMRYLPCRR